MKINCLKYLQIFHKCKDIIFSLGLTNEHTKRFGDLLHVIKQNWGTEEIEHSFLIPSPGPVYYCIITMAETILQEICGCQQPESN